MDITMLSSKLLISKSDFVRKTDTSLLGFLFTFLLKYKNWLWYMISVVHTHFTYK